nr:lipocalin family protein [Fertoeibacter niger]
MILLLPILLAACGARGPDVPPAFRDTDRQIYSNAVVQPAQILGEWDQVAGFATPDAGGCGPGRASFAPAPDGLALTARLCLNGVTETFDGTLASLGPGRFAPRGADPAGIGQPWWVVWLDTNDRTLVIGTPSGAFGFILNRGGPLPPDRLAAAREILDWNGYDLAQLRLLR